MITLDSPDSAGINLPRLRSFLARAQTAIPIRGEVSVLFTSDREIRRLNAAFRRKNKATDVLSFPPPPFAAEVAGDLAISIDTAARQAREFGHSLETELKILLIHGLLHLAGLDHESDSGEMAAREDQLRRRFRLPGALIARSAARVVARSRP